MAHYLEFTTADGSSIFVEATEIASKGGVQRASRSGDVIEGVTKRFEDAVGPLRGVSESLFNTFKELANKPKEITVEFSLKISAEAGVIISSGAVEGNFKVTLKWVN